MTTQSTAAEAGTAEAALERRFLDLAEQWHWETDCYSMSRQVLDHPAYREITAMGEVALPWILRDLEQTGGHWFEALRTITGENPASEAQRGRIDQVSDAWLEWGRNQDLVQ